MSGTDQFAQTSIDDFLDGRVKLIQPVTGFRAGQDSVLAAAVVNLKTGQTVLDIGAGAGAISLCMLARVTDIHVTAVEKQPAYSNLLKEAAKLNGLEDRLHIVTGDIDDHISELSQNFDHVVMNPPYFDPATSKAPDAGRAVARHTEEGLLDRWIYHARRVLRPKGQLALVYPASGLPQILEALKRGFGAVEVFPIYAGPNKPAKRLLLRATKNLQSPFSLSQGLYLRNADATPTWLSNAILRDGLGLDEAVSKQRDAKT